MRAKKKRKCSPLPSSSPRANTQSGEISPFPLATSLHRGRSCVRSIVMPNEGAPTWYHSVAGFVRVLRFDKAKKNAVEVPWFTTLSRSSFTFSISLLPLKAFLLFSVAAVYSITSSAPYFPRAEGKEGGGDVRTNGLKRSREMIIKKKQEVP